jgi:5-methylthioadenosine/S-adenosylhomocysteine deaminase
MSRQSADLLACGRIVTMDAARKIIDDGALAVLGNRIVAVGTRGEIVARFEARNTIDRPHAIILPGLIDSHTHVSQALVRGLIAHELPMIHRIYSPVTQSMTPEDAYVAASLCASQLLLAGVTTVCEGTIGGSDPHLEAILSALPATGIRANVVIGSGDQAFHHAALYSQLRDKSWRRACEGEAERDIVRTEAFLNRFPVGTDALITGGICASSLTNFSERYFRAASDLSARTGAKVHVHAARDREEVEFCLAVFGRRPIERLFDLGVVSDTLVVAHAMLATDRELCLLGQGSAGVAHSPIECLNILNAIPNIRLMRELGIVIGLGCDNAANDMFTVMRGAWILHTGTRGISGYDPEILDAQTVLEMATISAARLLGLGEQVGSLEPGKVADLIVLDGSGPHLRPVQDLVPELVRYGCRGDVRHVIVDGRVVVDDGNLVTIDLDALLERAATSATRLKAIGGKGRYRSICNV